MTPSIYSFINLLTISELANLNTHIEGVKTCLGGWRKKEKRHHYYRCRPS